MTIQQMLDNEENRIDVVIILDAIREEIDTMYVRGIYKFYTPTEIALSIYYDYLKNHYSVEDITRAFEYAKYEYNFLKGLERATFDEISRIATEELEEIIQKEIDSIPTFGDHE